MELEVKKAATFFSAPPRVVVGYHSWGLVHTRFCFSLTRAVAFEGNRIKRVIDMTSPYTDDARNRLIDLYLTAPNEDTKYFLMVDADIEFEADAISKTIFVAENHGADVVWGNYCLGGLGNSIFYKDKDTDLAVHLEGLNFNKVYPDIYGGGTGWCLINRQLLLDMQEKYPGPWHWFDRDTVVNPEGKPLKFGEDLTFGKRVAEMGRKQVGYTGLKLLHHKNSAMAPRYLDVEVNEMGIGTIEVN